jgi:gliding motility-associated-like protein
MKCTFTIALLTVLLFSTSILFAQTFTPVPVTGYNADVVAEAGLSSLAGTSTVIDASNHVIYTTGFAGLNGISGGIINTGTIISGTRTYQMAPYTANNALYMSSAGNVLNTTGIGTFTLTTPAAFSRLSLLAFATENNATLGVTFHFTDGTTATAANIAIQDWFGGNPFLISGMGRVNRLTAAPYTVDGIPGNPRMYAFDFFVPCASQAKLVDSIRFNYIPGPNISTRAVIMALSGEAYAPLNITSVITNAICGGGNGSIALTVSGGSSPFTYSWNTNPTKTTATATNLVAGTYTCNIRDANSCVTPYQATVIQKSAATLNAIASSTLICAGETSTLSVTATGATVSAYEWNPGKLSGDNITVTPDDTTQYIVTAKDAFGCNVTDTVDIAVKPSPTADFSTAPDSICLGTVDVLTYAGNAGTTATYNWNNFAGATVQSGSDGGPYNIMFNSAGDYDVKLQVTENGCASVPFTKKINVAAAPVVSMQVSKTPICSGEAITISFTGTASVNAVSTWGFPGGTVRDGTGPGPYNVRYQQSGNVTLTVKDGACIATATPLPVTVIPMPVADFTPDVITGCDPVNITFTNQSQNAITYKWIMGDGSTAAVADPSHTYTTPGTYTVTLVAVAQQCADTLVKTALINVVPPPVAGFSAKPGENTPIEYKNATFNFSNSSQNGTSYKWEFGDDNTSTDFNPIYKWELPGDYRVTLYVTNDIGCTDSISHAWYKIIPDLVLQIPNAFSPNGDGVNDRWNIDGLKARPGCLIEVYNRWGQIVHKSEGYKLGWDGTREGKLVSSGTYYYVIKTAPGEKLYTGWVVLLR